MISPIVSIVIPCYNQSKYLRECLDSVMVQTLQNFEVIVINDGSNDAGNEEIFKTLNYPKTQIIHQENKGVMFTRNKGIALAKGKYILPLDADDKIAPCFLEKAVAVLEQDPDVGIVGGAVDFFGSKTGRFKLPKYAFPQILGSNCLVCSCVFRRDDWKKVGGYNLNMIYGLEDYDFWLSIIELGRKVYQFNEVFLYYRQKDISRSTELNYEKNCKMRRQIVLNHLHLFNKYPRYKKFLYTITQPIEKTVFISVVRNHKMYNDFVRDNNFNQGAEFVCYDNTAENIFIPKRYNNFLDNYDYTKPAWFVFCHEDWQAQSHWLYQLKKLDKNAVYGVCGTRLITKNKQYAQKYFLGEMNGSDKKGNNKHTIGTYVKTGTIVDTFDCVCLIIHSSLIKKHNIRFDENLTWHLYTEEMCIRLKEQYNIPSRILQIQSQHYSWGNADSEFDKSFSYLIQKFGKTENVYSCTVDHKTIKPISHRIERVEKEQIIIKKISFLGIPIWTKQKYINPIDYSERKEK